MTFQFSPEIRETITRLADAENVDFVEIVEAAVKLLDRTKRGRPSSLSDLTAVSVVR